MAESGQWGMVYEGAGCGGRSSSKKAAHLCQLPELASCHTLLLLHIRAAAGSRRLFSCTAGCPGLGAGYSFPGEGHTWELGNQGQPLTPLPDRCSQRSLLALLLPGL